MNEARRTRAARLCALVLAVGSCRSAEPVAALVRIDVRIAPSDVGAPLERRSNTDDAVARAITLTLGGEPAVTRRAAANVVAAGFAIDYWLALEAADEGLALKRACGELAALPAAERIYVERIANIGCDCGDAHCGAGRADEPWIASLRSAAPRSKLYCVTSAKCASECANARCRSESRANLDARRALGVNTAWWIDDATDDAQLAWVRLEPSALVLHADRAHAERDAEALDRSASAGAGDWLLVFDENPSADAGK